MVENKVSRRVFLKWKIKKIERFRDGGFKGVIVNLLGK